MVKPPKIVVIGAGSAIFGLGAMATIIRSERMHGAELALVDINEPALATMTTLAEKMNQSWGAGMTITSSTNRRELLPGADFVIVSVQVGDRETVWEMDYEIPLRHGIHQPYAENGGPGSIAHTARNLPLMLDIAYDMEELCPDAWYLNLTNPLIRLTWGISRYTSIKVLGLCHQLLWGYAMAGAILSERYSIPVPEGFHVHTNADNMPNFIPVARAAMEHLDIKAAGINHFSWVYDIRDRATGEDLYPELRDIWFNNYRSSFEPLTREMFQIFGQMPTPGDAHLCEFLPWVVDPHTRPWEKYHLTHQDWEGNRRRRARRRALAESIVAGETSVDELLDVWKHDILEEPVVDIIAAIHYNNNYYNQQLNIPNNGGLIPNLPEDAIVEVPGLIAGMGVQGMGMPPLPEGIAELCRRELELSSIVVEAAAHGDKNMMLQALLLDPMVSDIDVARAIMDDFLNEFAEYLPQF
jgi:alpha-galactosidase